MGIFLIFCVWDVNGGGEGSEGDFEGGWDKISKKYSEVMKLVESIGNDTFSIPFPSLYWETYILTN